MIELKSGAEVDKIAAACQIVARALALAERIIEPGISTKEIDRQLQELIVSEGAVPSFLGYRGYPASTCISVDEVIVHGIPGNQKIKDGDLVSVDVGAYKDGFHGDGARTFLIGNVSEEKRVITRVVRESLEKGITAARPGGHIGDISAAIQAHAESNGFSVVRSLVGHGIGRHMHEDPQVPNYGVAGEGPLLKPGMTLAIEPMINAGTHETEILDDGWTIVTSDGRISAHWENTIAITETGTEVLTVV
jgi:methionyl aminopeptidase